MESARRHLAAKLEAKVGRPHWDVIHRRDSIDEAATLAAPKADAPEIDGHLFIRRKALENLSVGQIVDRRSREAGELRSLGARGLGHRVIPTRLEQASALALLLALLIPHLDCHPILWTANHSALHIDIGNRQKRSFFEKSINDVLYMFQPEQGGHTIVLTKTRSFPACRSRPRGRTCPDRRFRPRRVRRNLPPTESSALAASARPSNRRAGAKAGAKEPRRIV